MTFVEAIQSGFNRYFEFTGRSARSEYWYWALFAFLVGVGTAVIDGVIFGSDGVRVLNMLASLGLFIPGLAMAVRRLHDGDRSGWWLLILFIPLVGILVLLFWFVQAGTPGSNQFGDDPLGGSGGNNGERGDTEVNVR